MLDVSAREGVGVLRLARAPVNAMNLEMLAAITHEVEEAGHDDTCRAIVITGQPGIFSAGIDTKALQAYSRDERRALARGIEQMSLELYAQGKPLVAAISGHALGGGLVLALTCDIRLAARGPFQLGLTEAAAGVAFPDAVLALVQAELSPERARRLALGADGLRPEAPELFGVVDRLVEPDRLEAEAIEEARRLAALPGYHEVKRQMREDTVALMRHIISH
jgi:enoyl-CoA hydratase/carnithine racemase